MWEKGAVWAVCVFWTVAAIENGFIATPDISLLIVNVDVADTAAGRPPGWSTLLLLAGLDTAAGGPPGWSTSLLLAGLLHAREMKHYSITSADVNNR